MLEGIYFFQPLEELLLLYIFILNQVILFSGSGPWGTSATQTIYFVRIGGKVTLSIPAYSTTVTANSAIGFSSGGYDLPAYLIPARNVYHSTYVYNNNAYVLGTILIDTTGYITIYVGFNSPPRRRLKTGMRALSIRQPWHGQPVDTDRTKVASANMQ